MNLKNHLCFSKSHYLGFPYDTVPQAYDRQCQEHSVFNSLLQMVPGLEEQILDSEQSEVIEITELVAIFCFITPRCSIDYNFMTQLQKGVSSARSDDTKGLKGAILDWIVPHGQSLYPPIARNLKIDRGFNHEHTGALLCPANMDWSNPELVSYSFRSPMFLICGDRVKSKLQNGEIVIVGDQWPIFLYVGYKFDPEELWKGLLRSALLVMVRICAPFARWTDTTFCK